MPSHDSGWSIADPRHPTPAYPDPVIQSKLTHGVYLHRSHRYQRNKDLKLHLRWHPTWRAASNHTIKYRRT